MHVLNDSVEQPIKFHVIIVEAHCHECLTKGWQGQFKQYDRTNIRQTSNTNQK